MGRYVATNSVGVFTDWCRMDVHKRESAESCTTIICKSAEVANRPYELLGATTLVLVAGHHGLLGGRYGESDDLEVDLPSVEPRAVREKEVGSANSLAWSASIWPGAASLLDGGVSFETTWLVWPGAMVIVGNLDYSPLRAVPEDSVDVSAPTTGW